MSPFQLRALLHAFTSYVVGAGNGMHCAITRKRICGGRHIQPRSYLSDGFEVQWERSSVVGLYPNPSLVMARKCIYAFVANLQPISA
jgi:hypothetical protein